MNGNMVVAFLLLNALCVAQSMPSYSVPNKPQTFCGRHLDEAVSLACGYKNGKRSARNYWNYEYDEENASSDDGARNRLRFPLFQKNSPGLFDTNLEIRGKKESGIVQECCKTPCSINYIAEWYCG